MLHRTPSAVNINAPTQHRTTHSRTHAPPVMTLEHNMPIGIESFGNHISAEDSALIGAPGVYGRCPQDMGASRIVCHSTTPPFQGTSQRPRDSACQKRLQAHLKSHGRIFSNNALFSPISSISRGACRVFVRVRVTQYPLFNGDSRNEGGLG